MEKETKDAQAEHKRLHTKLHQSLDELVADFIMHTGTRPSKATVLDLIRWSADQTDNPSR